MNESFLLRLVLPVAFIGLLAGCLPSIPDQLSFRVTNDAEAEGNPTCSGGLKATFEAGSIRLESPIVAPPDGYQKGIQPLPSDVGVGTPVKIEAWCYDADDPEATGYVRIEQPWQANATNNIFVYPRASEAFICAKAVEKRGSAPCVRSFLLENE